MNNLETPIKIYAWIEYFCLSLILIFITANVQPLLIFIIGVLGSVFYVKNIDKYYKFTISYIITYYIFSILILYKQESNVLTMLSLSIIVCFVIYYVRSNYKEGKTVWQSKKM